MLYVPSIKCLSTAKRHDDPERDARQLLQGLVSGKENELTAGDPILLGESYIDTPVSQIATLFGSGFADELVKTQPSTWSGPLKSSFGLHLVRVTGVEDAHVLPFESVRDAVQREWLAQHRAAAMDQEYKKLRATYRIRVIYPQSSGPQQ
jgi:hypothetical protein